MGRPRKHGSDKARNQPLDWFDVADILTTIKCRITDEGGSYGYDDLDNLIRVEWGERVDDQV